MNEPTSCIGCQKYTGSDTCWWYGKLTLQQQVNKIVHGCEKYRQTPEKEIWIEPWMVKVAAAIMVSIIIIAIIANVT
jgi:hypothetical protein